MNMDAVRTVGNAIGFSRPLVEMYPRERFGSLAMDTELVVIIDAKLRYLHTHTENKNIAFDDVYDQLYTLWRAPMNMKTPKDSQWSQHDQIAAMIYLLWSRTSSDPMHRIKGIGSGALGVNSNDGVGTLVATEWFNRYSFLYDNPEALPYFEAGFFEQQAIKNAIENDIDPSLIASVVA